jgi:hypothetical protein
MPKHKKDSAYEGAVQQDCELLSLARQLPTDCFDIKRICLVCDFMARWWYGRESLCWRRCTHASVRRMDLQILCSKALSRTWRLLADSGGDLDRAERGLQWLLITYAHTYAIVILSNIGRLSSSQRVILWLL